MQRKECWAYKGGKDDKDGTGTKLDKLGGRENKQGILECWVNTGGREDVRSNKDG